mgnify:CR=1 FL=1
MPFFLIYRVPSDLSIALFWTGYSSLFLLVMLAILYYGVKKKKFNNFDVSNRKQRPLLFTISMLLLVLYVGGIFFFHGPTILVIVSIGMLGGLVVVGLINTRIKASMHMATLVGLITPIILSQRRISVVLLGLIPVVGWARVRIKRHTVPELIVGGIFGSLLSLLLYIFSQHIYD